MHKTFIKVTHYHNPHYPQQVFTSYLQLLRSLVGRALHRNRKNVNSSIIGGSNSFSRNVPPSLAWTDLGLYLSCARNGQFILHAKSVAIIVTSRGESGSVI